MTTFTAESPLYFVMRHAEGNRILSERVPTLVNNPALHTLYFHEVGTILGTEEALQGKPRGDGGNPAPPRRVGTRGSCSPARRRGGG